MILVGTKNLLMQVFKAISPIRSILEIISMMIEAAILSSQILVTHLD